MRRDMCTNVASEVDLEERFLRCLNRSAVTTYAMPKGDGKVNKLKRIPRDCPKARRVLFQTVHSYRRSEFGTCVALHKPPLWTEPRVCQMAGGWCGLDRLFHNLPFGAFYTVIKRFSLLECLNVLVYMRGISFSLVMVTLNPLTWFSMNDVNF